MKVLLHTPAIILTMLMLLFSSVQGQDTVVMMTTGAQTIHLAPGQSIVVQDPGGNGNYPPDCDTRLNVVNDGGTAVRVSGWVALDSPNDLVGVFNCIQDHYHNVVTRTGHESIDAYCYSSIAVIYFYSNTFIDNQGYQFTVTACGSASTISDVRVSDITGISAHIEWNDNSDATEWTVKYGSTAADLINEVTVHQMQANINNLHPFQTYFFRIYNNHTYTMPDTIERLWNFTTQGPAPVECVPYDQLESQWVTCRYGTFVNPDQTEGIVEYETYTDDSRHHVCRDTSERDNCTGNQLRTIPEGFTSSVRLGNKLWGAQAESITYCYIVDTAVTPLLIMRYAAVLEEPGHELQAQPKFTFDVRDIHGLSIDSRCYSATFIADSSLGWNLHEIPFYNEAMEIIGTSRVLWKDWTAVGIDLAPLHGQTIFIKLTTYDCAAGAHFGYAYFVFECGDKSVTAENCGEAVENVFSAPDGFTYRWYEESEPDSTLSEEQSLHVLQSGDYHCTLGFVGEGSGESCSFNISARSGYRYPHADYEVRVVGNEDCYTYVRLLNRSVVALDPEGNNLTDEPCEGALWMIDDTVYESSEKSPLFLLPPGHHDVRQVAILSGGMCADTIQGSFWLSNPCDDTIHDHACYGQGYRFFDTVIYEPGVYVRDSGYHHRTLFLDFGTSYDTVVVNLDIYAHQLPFRYGGVTFTDSVSNYLVNVRDVWGCDSIVLLNLNVFDNMFIHIDTAVCDNEFPLIWGDTLIEGGGEYTINYQNVYGTDSIVELFVVVLRAYDLIHEEGICSGQSFTWIDGETYFSTTTQPLVTLTAANGCDSVIHLRLNVSGGVEALMDITPQIVDYENDLVELRDLSRGNSSRQWFFLGESDTSALVLFHFPANEDSIEVMLVARHGEGCVDTARGMVLADHAVVWAPNAFTPDEDLNNLFRIFGAGLLSGTVSVYNRQGLLITTFDLLTGSWDGTYHNHPCPEGAYVYLVDYISRVQPRQSHYLRGTVLLIR